MISTENAGGLLGINNATGKAVTVKILIGTRIESLGRDAQVGEVVEISQKDAAFLLPYGYATRDLEADAEVDGDVATDSAPETLEGGESDAETADEEVVTTPVVDEHRGDKRSGKRR